MACVSVRRMDFDRQGMVYHHPPGFAALCLKCYALFDKYPAAMAITALGDGSLAFFPSAADFWWNEYEEGHELAWVIRLPGGRDAPRGVCEVKMFLSKCIRQRWI